MLNITEIKNTKLKHLEPIKEIQDIFIPGVDDYIPNRNGFIYLMSGAPGSGKTSLMLNMFKSKHMYRNKFHNIYLITPEGSFNSIVDHPFKNHDKIYHELTVDVLEMIYQELLSKKKESTKKIEKDKNKLFEGVESGSSDEEEEKRKPIEYSCIIIDDYASNLKDADIQQQLNKMLIKSRQCCCACIFLIQSYMYYPKILRKQITNITIFKTRNTAEFISLSDELFNMKKDESLQIFNYCFDKPYNHLHVDTTLNDYYKNWNKLIITTSEN